MADETWSNLLGKYWGMGRPEDELPPEFLRMDDWVSGPGLMWRCIAMMGSRLQFRPSGMGARRGTEAQVSLIVSESRLGRHSD